MNKNLTRRSFVASSAAAASIALAACGNSGSKPAEGNTEPETYQITFCLDYTPNTNQTTVMNSRALPGDPAPKGGGNE